jgi:hypothetical protein
MLLYLPDIHVWFMVEVKLLTQEVGLEICHILVVPLYANSSVDRRITWWVSGLPGIIWPATF